MNKKLATVLVALALSAAANAALDVGEKAPDFNAPAEIGRAHV